MNWVMKETAVARPCCNPHRFDVIIRVMPRIQVDDIGLYCEVAGQGEPVLFLHGLGSSSAAWEFQRQAFASEYQLIMPDIRGHGRSDKPPGPYSMILLAADIVSLLDTLDIPAVHVVGLSLGGMIGFQLAVDRPERVRSLVAVNCGPEVVPSTFRERWAIWQRRVLVNLFSMERIAQTIGARLFPEPDQTELRQMAIEGFAANDKPAYKAATGAILGWSVRQRLGEIRCPVLLMASDMDYTPVATKERYLAEIPGAKLVVIENSRHAAPLDQPAAFNAAVGQFLASVA
jgi:3-oxoadipate enol-lactonase